MNEDKEIIDVSYDNMEKLNFYTVEVVARKLGVSTTKVNHWIFKLNKINKGGFFENPSKLSEIDFEKIELAQELLEDGMTYEEVADYFEKNSHGIINREDNSAKRDLNTLDVQVISKGVTLEVKKQSDRIISVMKEDIMNSITESFKEEASKIAHVSLEAMAQSKDEMISEIKEVKAQNEVFRNEIERMYNRQTEELRRKLEEKERVLEELKVEKSKKGLFSIFKRK